MLFVQWMRAELEYFCLAAYKGSQSVVALENKLVYVNYNLRLRLEEVSGPPMREEGDFIDQLAHLSFYDENNPVREWMEYGRSNRAPV